VKRVNRVQRIARHEEKTVVKRIFWLTIFSVVLVTMLFTVGLKFLGGFADFLDSIFKQDESQKTSALNSSLSAPIIDSLPKATNEERITISGFSGNGSNVEIYRNSNKIDQTDTYDGRFEFKDFLLNRGKNEISLKAVSRNGESSDFSKTITVILDKEPPKLEISTPEDEQHFSGNNRVKIMGKTEPEAQVFAQGFLANVNSNGDFEITIPLESEGENKIEIKASDEAGNSETKLLRLHFKK